MSQREQLERAHQLIVPITLVPLLGIARKRRPVVDEAPDEREGQRNTKTASTEDWPQRRSSLRSGGMQAAIAETLVFLWYSPNFKDQSVLVIAGV